MQMRVYVRFYYYMYICTQRTLLFIHTYLHTYAQTHTHKIQARTSTAKVNGRVLEETRYRKK